MVDIYTSTDGKAAFQLFPTMGGQYRLATVFTGSDVTTWGATQSDPSYANLAGVAGAYRIVSLGVRCYASVAPTAAQGRYIAWVINMETSSDLDAFDISNLTAAQEATDGALHDMELYWISSRTSNEGNEYVQMNAARPGLTGVAIGWSGCATETTIASVEVVVNYELLP